MVNLFTVFGETACNICFCTDKNAYNGTFCLKVFIGDFIGHQEVVEMVVVINFASTGKHFCSK